MTRLDGRFLKPGSIPADRLDPSIPLGSGAVPDGSVTAAKLALALLRKFVAVSWGEVAAGDPNTKTLPLQLRDYLGDPIPAVHLLRVTCDDRATLTVGARGTPLSGNGTPDLIAQTDGTGVLDLILTCAVPALIVVAAGPTQGSPLLDATATVGVVFE